MAIPTMPCSRYKPIGNTCAQQIVEAVIYNGGYWKLRQVSLGYDFTKHIPVKWPIKGVEARLCRQQRAAAEEMGGQHRSGNIWLWVR